MGEWVSEWVGEELAAGAHASQMHAAYLVENQLPEWWQYTSSYFDLPTTSSMT